MAFLRLFFGAVVAAVLGACASVPVDRGASVASDLLTTRSVLAASVPIVATPASDVGEMLAKPLTADDAVRLALMRNPRMRELYGELGFAQADVYDATRLSNPALGYLRLSGDGVVKATWSLSQSVTELLFSGYRAKIARSRLAQAQQRAAQEVLALEADVRAQYYRYVAANSVAQLRARAADAAQAAAQYAQRLYDAGNISELQLNREQAAAGIADIARRRAWATAVAERGALLNLLGFDINDAQVKVAEELSLPNSPADDVQALQSWALENRLDLSAAREAVAMWTNTATHARRWRWLGGIAVGAERESEPSGERLTGPGVSVEAPLFNQGGGQLLRARASVELAAAKVAGLELTIGNDIAVRHAALKTAAETVERYRQSVVPLLEHSVELSQQEHNFMLIGAFELLATKQQAIDGYQAYIESVRDYWIEHAELLRTAGGHLPEAGAPQAAVGVDARPAQAAVVLNLDAPAEHGAHPAPDTAPTSGEKP